MLLCSTRLLREPSGARLLSALVCNLGQEPLTTPTHHNPKNPLGHAPNGAAAATPPSRGRRRFAPPTLSQIISLFTATGRTSPRTGPRTSHEPEPVDLLHVLFPPKMVPAGARSAACWRHLGTWHPVKRHGVPSVHRLAGRQRVMSLWPPRIRREHLRREHRRPLRAVPA